MNASLAPYNDMHTAYSLVITSIAPPNDVLRRYAGMCCERGIEFIVIGDRSSPPDFELAGCDFWSLERQKTLPFRLASILPERHYARKNLGYLVAVQRGCGVIIETDDDNMPRETFWNERSPRVGGRLVENAGWLNVYRYFSDLMIWPRGLPLEAVRKDVPPADKLPVVHVYAPIQQGLADENPDVDAIYRLLFPLPQSFGVRREPILAGRGSWCPFNSQNTTWFREAFPLLYLPSTCSFRMTDIWRSYVAQRIAWENGWPVLFHNATVYQIRNEHDLMRDFRDETPGYLNNQNIGRALDSLELHGGADATADNMRACYGALHTLGLVKPLELELLDAWIVDISSVMEVIRGRSV
jgi:hypothetical protein